MYVTVKIRHQQSSTKIQWTWLDVALITNSKLIIALNYCLLKCSSTTALYILEHF